MFNTLFSVIYAII